MVITKLLKKVDLDEVLKNSKWRADFRKLDMTKHVSVEKDSEGTIWFVLKFPYALVKAFEEALVTDQNKHAMSWSVETRERRLKFYNFNIMSVDKFVRENGFDIDESFIDVLHQVEEVWAQQDNIIPHSCVDGNRVKLVNAVQDSLDYFSERAIGDIEHDMFLAKSMGFALKTEKKSSSVVEKISSDKNNHFWLKSNEDFFQLYQSVRGTTVLIIDRNTKDLVGWLEKFITDAEHFGVDTSLFRVCHREPKDSSIPLNEWIRQRNLGGKIEGGRLYIFKQKPAKWLFANGIDVKIIATNSYTPINDFITSHWINTHPCVCYISDIKPTKSRNKQIAIL